MWRDPKSGRLTYHDGWGKVRLVTQELTRRGLSKEIGEPEFPVRVRPLDQGIVLDIGFIWLLMSCRSAWFVFRTMVLQPPEPTCCPDVLLEQAAQNLQYCQH